MDALTFLEHEHRKLEALVSSGALSDRIRHDVNEHLRLEEMIVYPALRDRVAPDGSVGGDILRAYEAHRTLEAALDAFDASAHLGGDGARLDALKRALAQHVAIEESTVFTRARELLTPSELDWLGMRLERSDASP